jgi:predicted metal-dependent phosphoesterase TrpH
LLKFIDLGTPKFGKEKIMPGYDLHIHTNASDGVYNTEDIVKIAMKAGLEGIAITDHDTFQGLENINILSKKYNFPIIPGIELSTYYQNNEIHILGYLMEYGQSWFSDKLSELQNDRRTRILRMIDKLNELGYDVEKKEVLTAAGSGSIGRPHIAYVLLQKGYITSIQEAFRKLIGEGCPAYIPRKKLSPVDAIVMIKKAGGIPVMAHPGLSKSDNLVSTLIEHGLRGLEVFHPDHQPTDEKKYMQIAMQNELIITGGSDFHGHKMGTRFSLGSKTVPACIVNTLLLEKKIPH